MEVASSSASGMEDGRMAGSRVAAVDDVAGMDEVVEALREMLTWPVKYERQGEALGVKWPRGLLLHGPPGTGKTLAVKSVAAECGASLFCISASNVFGALVGESEKNLRRTFQEAHEAALKSQAPAVIFIDEIDALCPPRNSRRQQETRVVAQLLTLMDGIKTSGPDVATAASSQSKVQGLSPAENVRPHVVVVAATNRPNQVDPALRRFGRFGREIAIPTPSPTQREAILRLHARSLPLAADVDFSSIASQCRGFVGADLAAVCREAAMAAIREEAVGRRGGRSGEGKEEEEESGSGLESRNFVTQRERPASEVVEEEGSRSSTDGTSCSPTAAATAIATTAAQNGSSGGAAPQPLHPTKSCDWTKEVQGLSESSKSSAPAVAMHHFAAALLRVGPSVTRNSAAAEVPRVSWDDIGGLRDVKKQLQRTVEWPVSRRAAFLRLSIPPIRGVLLYGPPGCSKTSLVAAAANAANATLFVLSCAQLFSMYVGEGEALLRSTFKQARMATPSFVFFDEADVIGTKRQEGATKDRSDGRPGGGSSGVGERLLTTLLMEMDGLDRSDGSDDASKAGSGNLMVIAATNRPWALDPAMMRPGRLDLALFVAPPDTEGRLEALRIHSRGIALSPDVDFGQIAERTEMFSGADIAGLCREAAMEALRESLEQQFVAQRHFLKALATLKPSISREMMAQYEEWEKR